MIGVISVYAYSSLTRLNAKGIQTQKSLEKIDGSTMVGLVVGRMEMFYVGVIC